MSTRLLLFFVTVLLSMGISAAPVIDVVSATTSVCSNGTIAVTAHGSGALTYSITSGPVTHTGQSSDVFSALPAGNYTISVTDATGNSVTTTKVVTGGTYTMPVLHPYAVLPPCRMSQDLIVVGHVDSTTGAAPYLWQITDPSGTTTPYQNGDTFHVQFSGQYTVICADACGTIQSQGYTLNDDVVPNMVLHTLTETLKGCDSMIIDMTDSINGTDYNNVFPYTLILKGRNGAIKTFTQTARVLDSLVKKNSTTFISHDGFVEMTNTMPHRPGDTIYAYMVDGCGDTVSGMISTPIVDTLITYDNWNNYVAGHCVLANDNIFKYHLNRPNQWQVMDYRLHTIIASGSNALDSIAGNNNSVYLNNLPANNVYILISWDQCGDTVRNSFNWPEPRKNITVWQGAFVNSCLDNTGTELFGYNGFTSGVTMQVISGPAAASSSSLGYAYSIPYTYPKYFYGPDSGTFTFEGLAPGYYVYRLSDSCGNVKVDSFSMSPAFVVDYARTITYTPGCDNDNTIEIHYQNANNFPQVFSAICTITDSATGAVIYSYPFDINNKNGSLAHTPAGTYYVSSTYSDTDANVISFVDGGRCQTVYDTIRILPYYAPALTSVTPVICSGTLSIHALADSTTGHAPYTYALIAGPEIQAAQTGNTFTVSHYGVYTVQITDACGNSSTASVTLDSLAGVPQTIYRRVDSCFSAMVGGQSYTSDIVLTTHIPSVAGCDSVVYVDSVFIRGSGDVRPIVVDADTFCSATGGVLRAAAGYTAYIWGDGTTSSAITVSQAGAYALTVTDAEACTISAVSNIAFLDSPYLTSGWVTDTAVCTDAPLILHLTANDPNAQYIWEGFDAAQFGHDRTITDSGVYIFTVSNRCGATSYMLTAAGKECDETLYVPNTFTPNGDGINDYFQVYPSYNLKLLSLQIFNRWGEMVYEGTDQSPGWDGRYKSEAAPTGTYVYTVNALWPTGKDYKSQGSITLIR